MSKREFATGLAIAVRKGYAANQTVTGSEPHAPAPIRTTSLPYAILLRRDGRSEGMATEPKPMPKWKIDTIRRPFRICSGSRYPVHRYANSRRTGPSVTLDEIRHYAAHRFGDPKD